MIEMVNLSKEYVKIQHSYNFQGAWFFTHRYIFWGHTDTMRNMHTDTIGTYTCTLQSDQKTFIQYNLCKGPQKGKCINVDISMCISTMVDLYLKHVCISRKVAFYICNYVKVLKKQIQQAKGRIWIYHCIDISVFVY